MIKARCYNCKLETDTKELVKHCKKTGHELEYFWLNDLDYLKEMLRAVSKQFRIQCDPLDEQTIDLFEKEYNEITTDMEIDAINRLGGEEKIINEICSAIEQVYHKFSEHKQSYPEPESNNHE